MEFEIVIGFEVHTELKTHSKVWCGCPAEFGGEPNTKVCPICLGMPGTLPVLNKEAFGLALRTALALRCDVPDFCTFDRKNYYYPDLPKNYQISQNEHFIGTNGVMELEVGDRLLEIGIDNIHLEEDAGKNIHPEGRAVDYSLVDLNRAGTPLLEIVTKPDIRSAEEAAAFMNAMRQLLQYLGVSDCKMQEGSLRFELNMSLREKGSEKLGQKVEVKNLNSMATVMKCIEAEFWRQSDILSHGGRVASETRLWDDVKGETRAMRSKETANDYRYFPDPDLVEVSVTPELREGVQAALPELPLARRARFAEQMGLSPYDAARMTDHIDTANYFENAVSIHNNPKMIANWIMTYVLAWLNDQPEDTTVAACPVSSAAVAQLVQLIDAGTIHNNIAKNEVFPRMLQTGKMPSVIVEEEGLKPVDDSAILPIVERIIAENPAVVEQIQGGKTKAIGALMGKVMKESGGKANPQAVTQMIKEKLRVE